MDRGAWQATVQGATESGTTEHSTTQHDILMSWLNAVAHEGELKHAVLLSPSAQIQHTISGSGKYIPAEFRDQLEFAE